MDVVELHEISVATRRSTAFETAAFSRALLTAPLLRPSHVPFVRRPRPYASSRHCPRRPGPPASPGQRASQPGVFGRRSPGRGPSRDRAGHQQVVWALTRSIPAAHRPRDEERQTREMERRGEGLEPRGRRWGRGCETAWWRVRGGMMN